MGHLKRQDGFTLIELLLVVLLIAILAAIALPSFISHQKRAQDASAKSAVRNMYTQVLACHAVTEDFTKCDSDAELGANGLPWGTGPGQVSVIAAETTATKVVMEAVSEAKSGGVQHTFRLSVDEAGDSARTCSPADSDGCSGGSW